MIKKLRYKKKRVLYFMYRARENYIFVIEKSRSLFYFLIFLLWVDFMHACFFVFSIKNKIPYIFLKEKHRSMLHAVNDISCCVLWKGLWWWWWCMDFVCIMYMPVHFAMCTKLGYLPWFQLCNRHLWFVYFQWLVVLVRNVPQGYISSG